MGARVVQKKRKGALQAPKSHDSSERPWRIAKVAGAVSATLATLFISWMAIADSRNLWPFSDPSAQQAASEADGRYPSAECMANYATTSSVTLRDDSGATVVALVELRRGSDCGASWLWVSSEIAGATVAKYLSRESGDGLSAVAVEETDLVADASGPGSESFTEQIYSPGCLHFEVLVTDSNGAELAALQRTEDCPL